MLKQLFTALTFICFSYSAFASAGGGGGASLLSYDMLFKAINLVILLLILHRFARKPIAKMLSSSAENTKETVDSARAELEGAKARLAEYEAKIANLETELATREKTSIAAIEVEKEKLIADAKLQATKLEEQTQNRIEQDILRAKTEIREFLVNESVSLAEKTISEQIGGKERKALIENYAKNLNETA
jgi:F-type H+-transporting ATPase subunit b